MNVRRLDKSTHRGIVEGDFIQLIRADKNHLPGQIGRVVGIARPLEDENIFAIDWDDVVQVIYDECFCSFRKEYGYCNGYPETSDWFKLITSDQSIDRWNNLQTEE